MSALGKLPNLDLIHTFGCLAYMPLSDRERADNVKTSSSRVKVVHLGFDTKTKGYFVYVPESKQYTTARGLHFNDDEYYTPPELARGATPLKKIKRKDRESERPDSEITGTHACSSAVWPRRSSVSSEFSKSFGSRCVFSGAYNPGR